MAEATAILGWLTVVCLSIRLIRDGNLRSYYEKESVRTLERQIDTNRSRWQAAAKELRESREEWQKQLDEEQNKSRVLMGRLSTLEVAHKKLRDRIFHACKLDNENSIARCKHCQVELPPTHAGMYPIPNICDTCFKHKPYYGRNPNENNLQLLPTTPGPSTQEDEVHLPG